jgi:hypothetical protein
MTIIRLISTLLVLASFASADTWTTPVQVPMASSSWDWCMPSISRDGQKLFFASDSDGIADYPHDLYYSLKVGGIWSEQVFLGLVVNSAVVDDLSPCIGYDDTTLYFARGNDFGDSIFVSYFTGGAWTAPSRLSSTINADGACGPAISRDGSTLYFSSNRTGGYGGYDIWKSEQIAGTWQSPINMGTLINTTMDEYEPSITGNDTDFIFDRKGSMQDTLSIWHIRLGTGNPAECLFHGHYEPYPHNGTYWYESPCISWDGNTIYLTYEPFNVEALHYIYSSAHPVAVESDPLPVGGSGRRFAPLAAPNPVRFTAVISFSLPRAGGYNLRIFNLLGQQVKAFAGSGQAGANAVTWNVNSVTNGVYFYQLGFEGKTATQRLVVLK